MAEFTGLGYYAEIPAVIFDVQRVRPVNRSADAHRRSRTSCRPRVLSHGDTKHPLLLPGVGHRVLHDGDGRVRPRRAAADAGLRDVGPRPRHEHLDVAAVRLPDQAARPRQAARRRRRSSASASSRATATWTATASRTARCPATACRRTSRADPATTRRRSTASAPTTTRRTSIGWRASSRRRGRWCRSPKSSWPAKGDDRHHRLRHDALGDRRVARPADERSTSSTTSYLRLRGVSVHAGGLRVHRRVRPRLRRRAEPRRPDAVAAQDGVHTRRSSPSCAASATTPGCRSTAARSRRSY